MLDLFGSFDAEVADDDDDDVCDEAASALSSDAALFAVPKERRASIFWDLKSAAAANRQLRFWCAPMVGASDLPFRLLVRERGCGIASTQMFPANGFAVSADLVERAFDGVPGAADRPLVVQFSANDARQLLRAARTVEHRCDAVELNLGCPQMCAKNGHYGAFLMDDVALVCDMVRTLAKHLSVPVLAKIRIFPEYERTLAYATAIVDAGASVLTVHARTREQKRSALFLADWSVIRRLVDDLGHRCAIVANGNVRSRADAERCLQATGAVSVMSASAILVNPALFDESEVESESVLARGVARNASSIDKAIRYLELVAQHGAPSANVLYHLHHMLRPSVIRRVRRLHGTMQRLPSLRQCSPTLAAQMLDDLRQARESWLQLRNNKSEADDESDSG
jgi:tRNA-dihydrouridine synthase